MLTGIVEQIRLMPPFCCPVGLVNIGGAAAAVIQYHFPTVIANFAQGIAVQQLVVVVGGISGPEHKPAIGLFHLGNGVIHFVVLPNFVRIRKRFVGPFGTHVRRPVLQKHL